MLQENKLKTNKFKELRKQKNTLFTPEDRTLIYIILHINRMVLYRNGNMAAIKLLMFKHGIGESTVHVLEGMDHSTSSS